MTWLDHIAIRELMNGTWFFLNIALAITFWRHVAERLWNKQGRYDKTGTDATIGLAVYFTGSAVMRAWVWSLLLLDKKGDDVAFLADHYEVALAAAGLAIVGALCCIRAFAPGKGGRWFWIGTAVVAVGVPILVHFAVGS